MVNEGELTQFDKKALAVLDMAKSIIIRDDEGYEEVGKFLTGLKAYQKELDATFDPALKAQRAALDELRDAKDRHAKPIKEAEMLTKACLDGYRAKRQAQIEAENRKALEAAVKGGKDLAKVKPQEMPKLAGVSYRKDYCAEVVRFAAFLKWVLADLGANGHYIEPNLSALKKLAQATKGAVPVPGVKFSERDIVSGRAA